MVHGPVRLSTSYCFFDQTSLRIPTDGNRSCYSQLLNVSTRYHQQRVR